MAEISNADLKKEIQEILKDADLENTSAKKVRMQLQEKHEVDLTERKKEIDQLILEVINEHNKEESSEEEEEEEEEKPKKKAAPKRKKKGSSDDDGSDFEAPKKPKAKKAGGGGGYTAPVKLSAEVADIVGENELPRHEVVKRMWAYIKENQLQDPKNKQMIKCDEKLAKIVPVKKFRGFGMAKYLKDHMNVDEAGESVPLKPRGSDEESEEESTKPAKKSTKKKKGGSSDDSGSDFEAPKKTKAKKKAGGGERKAGGYTAPVKLSAELADIVGENEMPRHEVVKRMWAYIKDNKLQDPRKKTMIKCDEKMLKIIPVKKFLGFGMTKYLKDHMNVSVAGESVGLKPLKGSDEDSGSEEETKKSKKSRKKKDATTSEEESYEEESEGEPDEPDDDDADENGDSE